MYILGSGDNYVLIGNYDDNGWGHIQSANNCHGLYFNTTEGNFEFDTGSLGSHNDAEVDVGFSGNRFRCGWFSSNMCVGGTVTSSIVCATSCISVPSKFCFSANGAYFEMGGTMLNPDIWLKQCSGNTTLGGLHTGRIQGTTCVYSPIVCGTSCVSTPNVYMYTNEDAVTPVIHIWNHCGLGCPVSYTHLRAH